MILLLLAMILCMGIFMPAYATDSAKLVETKFMLSTGTLVRYIGDKKVDISEAIVR